MTISRGDIVRPDGTSQVGTVVRIGDGWIDVQMFTSKAPMVRFDAEKVRETGTGGTR